MFTFNFFSAYFLGVSFLLSLFMVIDVFDYQRDRKSLFLIELYGTKDKTEGRLALLDVEFPTRTYAALPEMEKRALEGNLIALKREFFPEQGASKPL